MSEVVTFACPNCKKAECTCGWCEPCEKCEKLIDPTAIRCPFCKFNFAGNLKDDVVYKEPPRIYMPGTQMIDPKYYVAGTRTIDLDRWPDLCVPGTRTIDYEKFPELRTFHSAGVSASRGRGAITGHGFGRRSRTLCVALGRLGIPDPKPPHPWSVWKAGKEINEDTITDFVENFRQGYEKQYAEKDSYLTNSAIASHCATHSDKTTKELGIGHKIIEYLGRDDWT